MAMLTMVHTGLSCLLLSVVMAEANQSDLEEELCESSHDGLDEASLVRLHTQEDSMSQVNLSWAKALDALESKGKKGPPLPLAWTSSFGPLKWIFEQGQFWFQDRCCACMTLDGYRLAGDTVPKDIGGKKWVIEQISGNFWNPIITLGLLGRKQNCKPIADCDTCSGQDKDRRTFQWTQDTPSDKGGCASDLADAHMMAARATGWDLLQGKYAFADKLLHQLDAQLAPEEGDAYQDSMIRNTLGGVQDFERSPKCCRLHAGPGRFCDKKSLDESDAMEIDQAYDDMQTLREIAKT
eukprot:gnl/TRDRNA2_/TRDRNA2_49779_c0_seq1.p1 gnl/TRDRNA2_/TRDRNA2_49779_c0~~gnl/TRDRNA2_/TRDRNA2_49779_c0_seq1.p1  ORF type:complete len:295 (-),score=52.23 gnl/TRDRNA2_/TRDRNA2_49779_c0_seq1:56-940(-)